MNAQVDRVYRPAFSHGEWYSLRQAARLVKEPYRAQIADSELFTPHNLTRAIYELDQARESARAPHATSVAAGLTVGQIGALFTAMEFGFLAGQKGDNLDAARKAFNELLAEGG